jgi:septation ring formation regulator EzrA
MPDLISSFIGVAALPLTVYFAFRQENRVDGQSAAQRLVKIEAEIANQRVELANQQARQQGFQAEIEGVADHAERERRAIVENAVRDHNAIKELIKDVPDMRNLLARFDERFQSTKEEIKSLKDDVKNVGKKADRIVELLTPTK